MCATNATIRNLNILLKQIQKTSIFNFSNEFPYRCIHLTQAHNGIRSKWRAPMLKEMKKRVDELKAEGKYKEPVRSEFLEWNLDAELYAFGKRVNEEFNTDLLKEALTDTSYAFSEAERLKAIGIDESSLNIKTNVDLSKAGKELIEAFCEKYLRTVFPLVPEEGIRSIVDYLSSEQVLGKVGNELGLRDLILTKEHPPNEATYAKCLAAVVSCLNVSSGYERCQTFIRDFVVTQLVGKELWDMWQLEDPFGVLEKITIQSGKGKPDPRLIGDLGKDTIEAVFHIGIYDVDKTLMGDGFGDSVKMGLRVASLNTLSSLFGFSTSRAPLPFQKELNLETVHKNKRLSEWKLS